MNLKLIDIAETRKVNRKVLTTELVLRLVSQMPQDTPCKNINAGALAFKKAFDEFLAGGHDALAIWGFKPRCRTHAAPYKEAMMNAVSKGLAILRKNGLQQANLRPQ